MKRKLASAAFVLLGTVLTGCAGGGVYYARSAPPPPRYGVVGVAPGPGFLWVNGWWDWRGSNWYWVPGRWERPPRPHAMWVEPRWERHGHGWRMRRGHWR